MVVGTDGLIYTYDAASGSWIGELDLIETITNELQNPCLVSVLQSLNNADLKNAISKLLINTFGQSDKFNVTFIEDELSYASTSGGPDNYGNININVYLPTSLSNSSKEYIAETMFHEILHAYLDYKEIIGKETPSELDQHIEMAQGYVDNEVIALREIFPSLSIPDATALVLGGFGQLQEEKPDYFDNLLSKYNTDENAVASTNGSYKSGQKGTKCN